MNRRNLSGIYVFHKFKGEFKQKPTCFEDLPLEEQGKYLDTLSEQEIKRLAIQLAITLRGIGDDLDIYS